MTVPMPGVRDLIRLLRIFHQRDQFADIVHRQILVHEKQRRRRGDQADWRQVLARVVTDVAIKIRPGCQCRGVAEDNRVSVRRSVGDLAGANRAAAAGIAVLNHDPLAERRAHLVRDRPRHDVVGAAGRQRDDQNDRPVRVIVRHSGP